MPTLLLVAILFFLLLGLFCLVGITTSLRRLHKKEACQHLEDTGKLFFYRELHRFFFKDLEHEEILFAANFAQSLVRFFYAITATLLLVELGYIHGNANSMPETLSFTIEWPMGVFDLLFLFLLYFLVGDHLPKMLASHYPGFTMRLCAPIASLFMTPLFPLNFIFFKLSRIFSKNFYFHPLHEKHNEMRQEIIDIIEETNLGSELDVQDKKLIESVVEFKDRIAREVMVPRIDVFSLESKVSIADAAKLLQEEGYSRTPVYKDSLDNIIGVLMYKDVLAKFMQFSTTGERQIIEAPISTLVKNVLYTPETKKISHLLQEFKKKQVHLAIIVDEYGGTEGIVTIEDILETIVGDIEDEYDNQATPFIALPEGGWLVDGRMSLLSFEEYLNIKIPQNGDYETIGGYLFHITGTIPDKGYIVRTDNLELEVVRSNDRRVEKIRIKPINPLIDETQNT